MSASILRRPSVTVPRNKRTSEVVNPDDTTVIEEQDVEEVVPRKLDTRADSGTNVNVDVGGGKGVDVAVNRSGDDQSKP